MRVYLVGGAVRDKLLGLKVKERDWVVVGSSPQEMTKRGYLSVGKSFPVYLHPKTREEYALARTEQKTAKGYTGFSFKTSADITLEEDLLRRDLTVNAIAEDAEGNLYDPYNGIQDLRQKVLRHVSMAFGEDPLRVLRVARFAARFANLGFVVAKETMVLMRQLSTSDELNYLSGERIWAEMQSALAGPAPKVFFEVLRECHALPVILPEIAKLFDSLNNNEAHVHADSGMRALCALEHATSISNDPVTRFAALTHNIDKTRQSENTDAPHKNHRQNVDEILSGMRKRLAMPSKYFYLAKIVCLFHEQCQSILKADSKMVLELLNNLDARRKPDTLDGFLHACAAYAYATNTTKNLKFPQADYLRACAEAVRAVKLDPAEYTDKSPEQIRATSQANSLKTIEGITRPNE